MLMLLAAIAAAAAEPAPPAGVTVRAQATIRIISATRLRVGANRSEEGEPVRATVIRDVDGKTLPARLVEFE